MNEATETPPKKPAKERRKARRQLRGRRRAFLWPTILVVMFLLLGPVIALAISGRPIAAPDWVNERVESFVNASLNGGQMQVGAINVVLSSNWEPHIQIKDVALSDQTEVPIANFEEVEVTIAATPILRGKILPVAVNLHGASLSLRREPDGRFDLSLQNTGDGLGRTGSLADLLDAVDRIFETPELASIKTVRAEEVTFQYEDVRAARFWVATGGALELDQDAEKLDLRMGFQLLYGEETPAQAALTFTSFKGSRRATFATNIRDLPASDFSTQAPALAWLSVINAPVSGAIRAEIDDTGELSDMSGTLEIAAGVLQPTAETLPITFNKGRAYFNFDPTAQKITFNQLSVSTEAFSLQSDGHAYLRDLNNGWPETLLGQFRFSEVIANPNDLFDDAVKLDGGALDLRLNLRPFTLTIGQAMLNVNNTHLRSSGEISVVEGGWKVALDLAVDAISPQRMMRYWPRAVIPNTRKWLDENIQQGLLSNVHANLRVDPAHAPRLSLGFEFEEARVRFMKTLPPVEGGGGFATIQDNAFSLTVEKGQVTAPTGGKLDATGTVVTIADVAAEPTVLSVDINADGPIPAALSLLDLPPFELMTKAGQPTDVAEGRAEIQATVSLPLLKELQLEDVSFDVTGRLMDVQSDILVPGRQILADALRLRADNARIEIGGDGRLGAVPFRATWVQDIGADAGGASGIEGTIELSQEFVDEFDIGLPRGAVTGTGVGRMEIALRRGQAPEFQLTSDLNQVGLRISDIGWTKSASSTGNLTVKGRFGAPTEIDEITLSAAGLDATGQVFLKSDGRFDRAAFSRVRIGRWLDAPVALSARGEGQAPAVTVSGGTLDIRETTFGQGGAAAGGGQNTPINLSLDRLQVSDGIAIHQLRGAISTRPAINGQFNGLVNGQAPINGTLVPQEQGTAVRIRSEDAGAVMRAAGVFDKIFGGAMDLILVPRAENGQYNGSLTASAVRVRGASALADLLGAISVIGLLEQLNGQGIVFRNVEARFRLTPRQVLITSGSAVGASLGVSMEGVYGLESEQLDMQGVISPIYVVNGIGAILTRQGEGLFGFNYRLRGTANEPKVTVNPLSILTPGMFREIFRAPAPTISQQPAPSGTPPPTPVTPTPPPFGGGGGNDPDRK